MNFFDDDFDFGDYNPTNRQQGKRQSVPSKTTNDFNKPFNKKNTQIGFKDQFDLLDNLVAEKDKQKLKNNSKQFSKQISPSRGQSFSNNIIDQKQLNISDNIIFSNNTASKNQFKIFNDDKYSEDNRSQRSGATNKVSNFYPQKNTKNIQPFQPNLPPSVSVRNMKPPLRKRDSKEPSIFGEEANNSTKFPAQVSSAQNLQQPKLNESFSMKFQVNQPHKQKQKIVYVKEDLKDLKEAHQKQIKIIKQSQQRQLKYLQQNIDKEIKAHQQTRLQLLKQNQQNLQNQRKKWKDIQKQNQQRIKSLLQWQNKKKQQTYELQIQKLKKLLDTTTNFKKENQWASKLPISIEQIKLKEKQLEREKKRLSEFEDQMRIRQRNLQSKELEFEIIRKRQDDRIQQEKKKLFQLETKIKKQQIDIKRMLNSQKQKISTQLANSQLQNAKKTQELKTQFQELNLQKQFFQKQKNQMGQFNKKVMDGYKQKIQQLQNQKQKMWQLQMQLYQKIQTVQLMGSNKPLKPTYTGEINQKDTIKIKQNSKNQFNKIDNDKIKNTKERFMKIQDHSKKNNYSYTDRDKIELNNYLLQLKNKTTKDYSYV